MLLRSLAGAFCIVLAMPANQVGAQGLKKESVVKPEAPVVEPTPSEEAPKLPANQQGGPQSPAPAKDPKQPGRAQGADKDPKPKPDPRPRRPSQETRDEDAEQLKARLRLLNNDKVSFASLSLEKAGIQKALADELYLRDLRDLARVKYDEAQSTIQNDCPDARLDESQKSVKRLLMADVEYRLLNLDIGNDFWGGYRTNTPSTPHRHLLVLEELLREFENVTTQVDDLLVRGDNAQAELARLQGMTQDLTGKVQSHALEREKAQIEIKRERRKIENWHERVADLARQRLDLEQRMNSLAAQQQQLSSQASSLLTSAVSSAAGIPPELGNAIVSGDPKAALMQAALSQLGNPSSELSKSIGEISAEVNKLRELYTTTSQSLQKAQELKGRIEQFGQALRNPTLANLAKVGDAVWSSLPPETQNSLLRRVELSKPTSSLLSAYQRVVQGREELAAFRQRIDGAALALLDSNDQLRAMVPELTRQFSENLDTARNFYGQLYRSIRVTEVAGAELRVVLDRFVRVSSSDVLEALESEERRLLLRAMGAGSEELAIRQIAEHGLAALPQAEIAQGKLRLALREGRRQEIAIDQLFSKAQFANQQISRLGEPVEVARTLETFLTGSGVLRRAAVAQVPLDSLTASLEREFNRDARLRAQAWDMLAPGISRHHAEGLKKDMATQALGAAVAPDILQSPPAVSAVDVPRGSPTVRTPETGSTGTSPETQAVIVNALNYALPGAGAVFQMAQAFGQMSANASEIDRLANLSLKIMAEQEQLIEFAEEAYFQEAIAEKEHARAEALRDATSKQLGTYRHEMNRRGGETHLLSARLGLRRGWTFYVAERLREEFDLFDRSFAMWSRGASSRGVIASEIKSDPQNVRYALDSEIHLFDWLNRERESTKTDPDALRVHWSKLVRLAKDVCIKRGCKPGDGTFGQIAATREISLRDDLLSESEWQRFRNWQQNPSGRFISHFALQPNMRIVPLHFENVRIVDLRIGGRYAGAGSPVPVTQVSLRHPGVAYIPRSSEADPGGLVFQREALLPKSSASFDRSTTFNLDALRSRFDGPFSALNLPSLRVFEGYGMYTQYQLALEPTSENLKLDDVVLRFAYYYVDAANIVSEQQYMQKLGRPESDLPIDIKDWVIVGKQGAGCSSPKASANTLTGLPMHEGQKLAFASLFRDTKNEQTKRRKHLPPEQQKALAGLRSCADVELKLVCKPFVEIQRIAQSYFQSLEGGPIRDAAKTAPTVETKSRERLTESARQKVDEFMRTQYPKRCAGTTQSS